MSYYFSLPITNTISLVHTDQLMAEEIFQLVASDKEHLRPFLDFVDLATDSSGQLNYINLKLKKDSEGTDKLFCITFKNKIVGCADLHNMDQQLRKAEIGYWIHSDYKNQEIISQVVRKICDYAFNYLNLNKLIIIADTENLASNRVAQKAQFTFVGTDVDDFMMNGSYRNMNKYALLHQNFLSD